MIKKLFSLSPNDKFTLNEVNFTFIRYFVRNTISFGKTLTVEAKKENGEIQWFMSNINVKVD